MKLYSVLAAFVNKVAGALLYAADGSTLQLKVGDRVAPPATFSSHDEAQIARLTAARCIAPKDDGGKAKPPKAPAPAPVSHAAPETPPPADGEGAGGEAPGPDEGGHAASQGEGGGATGTDAVQPDPVSEPAGGDSGKRAKPKRGAGAGGRKKKTVDA